jgi:hypothetical protein
MSDNILNRIGQKGLEEGKRLFWIFLYLWALLGLFSIHKSLVLNEPNLFWHQGFALINAWLLAKVMITAEIFHVADNLKHKPLIYPILFKSVVFAALLVSFYLLEEILMGLWHGETIAESIPAVGGGSLKGILVVGFMMFIVLMPFFALRELGRVVGEIELYELFFVRRSKLVRRTSRLGGRR